MPAWGKVTAGREDCHSWIWHILDVYLKLSLALLELNMHAIVCSSFQIQIKNTMKRLPPFNL